MDGSSPHYSVWFCHGLLPQQYDKYFSQNDPSKGGSFYLQSKIYRAKECLEKEIEQEKATKKKKQQKASGEK